MARIILFSDPYRLYQFRDRAWTAFRRKIRHKIFSAIESGDDASVLRMATTRVLLRSRGEFGQSPVVAAIAEGRSGLACELIARGGTYRGDGSMAHAAMHGDLPVVEALIKSNKNPDEPLPKDSTSAGYTPLMWATNRKYVPIVRALLAAGADINAVSDDGTTAVVLTRDASPGSLEALEVLCGYGPDITIKDDRRRNLIREARDRERNSGMPEMRRIIERFFPGTDFDAS